MSNIFLIDEHPETKNLLIKCLETAGFEVVIKDNGLFNVQLGHQKFSNPTPPEKIITQKSIFPPIPQLCEVFEFIELNYHQNIKLKEVAKAVGYSSAYLTTIVRKLTGKTVNNWIIERRMVEASTLLLKTNDSVDEIAFKVGYQNTNHFYSQFRDYYQNTPRGWRESQGYHTS